MLQFHISSRLILCTIFVLPFFSNVFASPFEDVSSQAGLDYSGGIRKKYGGACIADLNNDGTPDLLLAHHDDKTAEAYLNGGNGKFNKLSWSHWDDTHAFVPYRARPYQKIMFFLLMRGGNYGLKPTAPLIYRLQPNNQIFEYTGPAFASGRGRTALFLPLNPSQPALNHVIFINAPPVINKDPHNLAGRVLVDGTFSKINLYGFEKEGNSFAALTDIDNDGRVEILTFENLRVYKVSSPFTLTEISGSIMPKNLLPIRGVVAVAELDYDNDGNMDLYIARSVTEDLKWLQSVIGKAPSDYLLRNVGGRYVDVTKTANIPGAGESRGVTVGDFNNDGHIDILVAQYTEPYRMLWNNGDGTFRLSQTEISRFPNSHGDQPAAVDYNLDGKLDLVLSDGDYFDRTFGGQYRIMKNIGKHPNYLLVRVGSSPKFTAASLHAVATVTVARGRVMVRRVGSPSTAVSVSYIELLHFGLGLATSVDVTVRWADGVVLSKTNVAANTIVNFGAL